jgi:ABC-type sugar transport system permease subunit
MGNAPNASDSSDERPQRGARGLRSARVAPYIFIAPFFIFFLVFTAYPLIDSIWLSTQDTVGLQTRVYAGGDNFEELAHDALFWKSLKNTLYFLAGSVFVQLPISLGLALILNARIIKAKSAFRFAWFSPVLIAGVFIAIIFGLIFDNEYGLLNYLLGAAGLGALKHNWIRDQHWVMPAIIMAGVWRWAGFNMIYFLAGLQSIRQELYEAASIDGANRWQLFLHITLPGMWPIIVFVVVMSTIGSLQLFDLPYILLGGGGPNDSGLTIVMYMYRSGFQYMRLGYAAAIGWVIFAIVFVVSMLQMRFLARVHA